MIVSKSMTTALRLPAEEFCSLSRSVMAALRSTAPLSYVLVLLFLIPVRTHFSMVLTKDLGFREGGYRDVL